MRLAIRHPKLIRSLILCNTSADRELEQNLLKYRLLNFIARWLGPPFVADALMPTLFGQEALNDPLRRLEQKQWRAQVAQNRRVDMASYKWRAQSQLGQRTIEQY